MDQYELIDNTNCEYSDAYKSIKEVIDVLKEKQIKLEKNYKSKIKELTSINNSLLKSYKDLEIKNIGLRKRIDKFEQIYAILPGSTREDKDRIFHFLSLKVLPWVIENASSRTFKKIEEWWEKLINREKEEREKLGRYYVYTHRIIGQPFPFYVGFSRNNDGKYNRAYELNRKIRSDKWNEYVELNGGSSKVDVEIIAEIEDEEGAKELESFYIRYYGKPYMCELVNVVGLQGKEDFELD